MMRFIVSRNRTPVRQEIKLKQKPGLRVDELVMMRSDRS